MPSANYDPAVGPFYAEKVTWFKSHDGWCKHVARTDDDGIIHQLVRERGVSDEEYFKRKLAGTS